MKRLFKKFAASLALIALTFGLFAYPISIANAASRDCDSNAIIYCGVQNKTELYNALNKGTGKRYQSAAELQSLFGYYRIYAKDFERLVEGSVTKDNRVVVNGKTVKNGYNVYSMGRSWMPGSTRVNHFSYPVYLRHPSVSFRSNSIPAYVYMNPDGTFAYAVIKSCGNIVPGRLYSAPAPRPAYILYALKWLDTDADGRWDAGEPRNSGITFRLTGNGVNRTAVTDSMGYAWYYGLPAGTYTLSEIVPSGYRPTTASVQTVIATGATGSRIGRVFGNTRIVPVNSTVGLQIQKFNDRNANGSQDSNEPALAGWRFRVSGPRNTNFILTTDRNGLASRSNLTPGVYTVTEVLTTGWENTTGLSVQRNIPANTIGTFVFGNRRIVTPETPETPGGDVAPTELPVSGPAEAAAMAFGTMSFSGAAVAWARSKKNLLKAFRK